MDTVARSPRWIDLHSHVLPGIDDGADSFEQAVDMCRRADDDGCTAVVATPHLRHSQWWNGERSALERLHRALEERLAGRPQLFLGGEIAVHSDSVDEIYELPHGELVTLAGSRYVLLELDWQGFGPDVLDVVHELKVKGLEPIIAHPERYHWLAGDAALLETLVERGALLQLTAMSVTGGLGPGLRDLCRDLLRAGMAHFVASDMHDVRIRPPGLAAAYRQVEADCGTDTARRIFVDHSQAVIEDRPLS